MRNKAKTKQNVDLTIAEPSWGERPFEYSLPRLCRTKQVQRALRRELGAAATAAAIKQLQAGGELKGDAVSAFDIIKGLVANESTEVKHFEGWGYAGRFPIDILRFEGVYWVQATEFPDKGYFSSKRAAITYADLNYGDFIRAAKEQESKE